VLYPQALFQTLYRAPGGVAYALAIRRWNCNSRRSFQTLYKGESGGGIVTLGGAFKRYTEEDATVELWLSVEPGYSLCWLPPALASGRADGRAGVQEAGAGIQDGVLVTIVVKDRW
jgi:hypothetical protein